MDQPALGPVSLPITGRIRGHVRPAPFRVHEENYRPGLYVAEDAKQWAGIRLPGKQRRKVDDFGAY